MQQHTTIGRISITLRQLLAATLVCLVAGCAAVPKTVAVSEERTPIRADVCDNGAEECESTLGERYHYYLGLLSVYLIGL